MSAPWTVRASNLSGCHGRGAVACVLPDRHGRARTVLVGGSMRRYRVRDSNPCYQRERLAS